MEAFRDRVIRFYRESIKNGTMTGDEKRELSPSEFYALRLESEFKRRGVDIDKAIRGNDSKRTG